MSPSSPRTAPRTLPDKPNLNQLKKQAKDLLKAFQAGEPTAIDEMRAHYPHPISGPQEHVLQLSDAQLVLARAYGFDSWPKLKAFVDGITMNRFVAAVETGDVEGVRAMLSTSDRNSFTWIQPGTMSIAVCIMPCWAATSPWCGC